MLLNAVVGNSSDSCFFDLDSPCSTTQHYFFADASTITSSEQVFKLFNDTASSIFDAPDEYTLVRFGTNDCVPSDSTENNQQPGVVRNGNWTVNRIEGRKDVPLHKRCGM